MSRVDDPESTTMLGRRRSVAWDFFETIDSEKVRCLLCRDYMVKQERGSTTNMLRHLRAKHPAEVKEMKGRVAEAAFSNGAEDMETDSEHFCSEVALEDGDSDSPTTGNDADSAINGILEAAQKGPAEQITREEAADDRPVGRRRSLIWRHYKQLDSLAAALCCICMRKLQCSEGSSTSNLRRHISTKHPKVFSQLVADEKNSALGSYTKGGTATPPERSFSVEVALEDEDSLTPVNHADLNSALNGILEDAQGDPTERITREEATDGRPVRHKRTLIWRHYEHLDSLSAARCRICMKKLKYFKGGSTRQLHQHMSKRHPELLSQLVADGLNPPQSYSSQGSNASGDTSTPPETVGAIEKRTFSGAAKVSQASEGERRLFRRERELIESMRRTQREEARALEHQRELLEKLRAVNAREAAAEREQIESLRKAQQDEAKDLNRQKDELQKEKAELQKKWEELQQEREELLSFTSEQQVDSVTT
ncbi:uncharacterized protein [Pagrus major]|uniref:uncharacterized protein isoform X2 n=1 Tax=Pagrus major TaxID=143350 RepID=UPI003CC8AED6